MHLPKDQVGSEKHGRLGKFTEEFFTGSKFVHHNRRLFSLDVHKEVLSVRFYISFFGNVMHVCSSHAKVEHIWLKNNFIFGDSKKSRFEIVSRVFKIYLGLVVTFCYSKCFVESRFLAFVILLNLNLVLGFEQSRMVVEANKIYVHN